MSKLKEVMVSVKEKCIKFIEAVRYSFISFRILSKGQQPKYEILMLAHRLEKGLLNENPKPLWGWEKAQRILSLMKDNNDEFSNRTGRGVLRAYIESKKNSGNPKEVEKVVLFLKNYPEIENENTLGGVIQLKKEVFTANQREVVSQFIKSRHSCRDFQDKVVSKEDIEAAVSLALRCPSACNRQVTNCYVYQSKELQTIILTTNIRAYEISEFNDWFVSPSIFAGYLSLSLHLYGIGSCVYRKQLYGHHPYNEGMRRKCNIPADEMIVLELRFGYYKDEFKIAVSNRHNAGDIINYFEE